MKQRIKEVLSLVVAGLLLLIMNAEGVSRAARFTVPEAFTKVSEHVCGALVNLARETGLYRVRRTGELVSGGLGLNIRSSEKPNGVLFLGDSVLEDIVKAFRESTAGEVPVSDVIMRGSDLGGLLWDWDNAAAKAARESRASTAVVMLDASDASSKGWREYADLIDVLQDNGVENVVLLARPVSSDDGYEADRVYRVRQMKRAAEAPGVTFADLSVALMGANGSFPDFVTGPDGVKVRVRDKDGYHLTAGGAEIITRELISVLGL